MFLTQQLFDSYASYNFISIVCELLPSLGVRRPLTFHILNFSSKTA
jgi:hypothetical protein